MKKPGVYDIIEGIFQPLWQRKNVPNSCRGITEEKECRQDDHEKSVGAERGGVYKIGVKERPTNFSLSFEPSAPCANRVGLSTIPAWHRSILIRASGSSPSASGSLPAKGPSPRRSIHQGVSLEHRRRCPLEKPKTLMIAFSRRQSSSCAKD